MRAQLLGQTRRPRWTGGETGDAPQSVWGSFSDHFDKVVGIAEHMGSYFYQVEVPAHERCTLGRTTIESCATLPHKALGEELASSSGFGKALRQAVRSNGWSRMYNDHEVVKRHHGGRVIPLAVYLDGVAFQKPDSAVGF